MHSIARALLPFGKVTVVAPAFEQSWIGRAMSRRETLQLESLDAYPYPVFSLTGSPTDCVNIALHHVLDHPPDMVVSGFNIGYNASIPLIYSSGTVAAATEAAFSGIPAVAASQAIADYLYPESVAHKSRIPDSLGETLRIHAGYVARFVAELLEEPLQSEEILVHNLNFPAMVSPEYQMERTVPARLEQMCLYRKSAEREFQFAFQHGTERPTDSLTDRQCLLKGGISHSILNFSNLAFS